MNETKHMQVLGVVSMVPDRNAGATCTCGWHSHSRTFAEHLAEVEAEK